MTSVPAIAWYAIALPSTVTDPLLVVVSGLKGSKRWPSGLSPGVLGDEPGAPGGGGGGAATTKGAHERLTMPAITQAPNTDRFIDRPPGQTRSRWGESNATCPRS